ncbi:hypothetical protein DW683_04680 [Bacteroides sp. AM25-34]|nr:hypothetical protein DW683_04680 [Bacteroides sp. AM25-34]
MQSHPLIHCTTFCISIGLMSFSPNPQYTFRSVPHISIILSHVPSIFRNFLFSLLFVFILFFKGKRDKGT